MVETVFLFSNLSDELQKDIRKWAERNPAKVSLDYRDELPGACVQALLDGDMERYNEELVECYEEAMWEAESWAIRNCISEFSEELYEEIIAAGFDEDEWQEVSYEIIREECLFGASIDDDYLMSHTSVHVVLRTNLEYWIGGWRLGADLDYEEIKDILDFFNINPRLVARYFDLPLSGWRDYHWRNDKHIVEPDKLFESMRNCPYGGEIAVLVDGSTSLKQIAGWNKRTPVKILKGSMFLIHDYVNGSGGLEFTSVRDATMKPDNVYAFANDNKNRYGVQSVHAMTESVWCSVIEIK